MKLGIVNDDIWDFFHEVYAYLCESYQASLFTRRERRLPVLNSRVNRAILQKDLATFMKNNDVLFFEWASDLLAMASNMPKTCGIVTRMHRYDIYKWIDDVNWDNVDRIILVSQAKRQEFAKLFPQHEHKIVVIPEAISLERFQMKPKEFCGNLGILCHLKPRKRVYDLVLAFYELSQKVDGMCLYIGGDKRPLYADYYEALKLLVRNLHLEDKVIFDGHISDPENWYRKIDVFISNSYSEGLQVSPIEAMASGCYCLSHRWDGADELLPEGNLYYSNSELIEKVVSYVNLPENEKQDKIAGLREMVYTNFDVDKTKVKIREVIEAVNAAR
jgi:glycosyltransferase involved in cell wall biosynthesis